MSVALLIGAMATIAAGAFFPWINGEAVIAATALVVPRSALPALVLSCAVVQMACKACLYGLVRWTPDRLPARARSMIGRAERFRERRGLLVVTILSGSLAAIPPFYLVTLACGVLRVPLALFVVAGLGGTIARYGLVAWAVVALGAG